MSVSSKRRWVSIPFKREGVSKGEKPVEEGATDEFQFPSNGKVYPKKGEKMKNLFLALITFQFPSNGKVYPK